ncbi:hypothetical protein AC578_5207 [Pseudocercospora eumusae]|uniref:Major facilitator superfamily (MFS) profile domain-containing protein n=1 Tax=Pseudocercospora eumusae TaxID=321146 RepID=A0A139H0J6_9PEZI|nr:hypothetical protein AC578_5207 [Pseudocercospora eumusae]
MSEDNKNSASVVGSKPVPVDDKDVENTSADVAVGSQGEAVDYGYLRSWKFSTFYRSVLCQMILFGALSLVGPAMQDAITNLGGGGLKTPWLANLANSLNYTMGCLTTLFGGPLINKFGIKWSCMIAACVFPLTGSAYYSNAKFGIASYLLTSQVIGGIGGGFLYVAETTAMLSYPKQDDRGFYLGIWAAMRNSGSVIGGAINFATNSKHSSAGGIAWATYLIFVGFECTGVIWAFLLSPTKRVRRRDGSKVPMSGKITWKQELQELGKYFTYKKTWLVFLPSFYSFFYGGTMGTYLSTHFSVRARALSTLLVPSCVIPLVIAYGRLLDMKHWTRRRRAWTAFLMWCLPHIICFIWIGIEYKKFGNGKAALDYGLDRRRWAEAYLPYLIIFVTGYWTQLSLYWILGELSTDVEGSARIGGLFRAFETSGQAVSYGINSIAGTHFPFYINAALLVLVIPCMVLLINLVSVAENREVVAETEEVVVPDKIDR